MEGKVVWRSDLKPVGEVELKKALAYSWGKEIRVSPRNYDRILEIFPSDSKVVLVANPGVSVCELVVYDGIPMPRLPDLDIKFFKKETIKTKKDRIPVTFIRSMLDKGSSEKEIRAFFAESQQVISLSQIRSIQENRTRRKYISVKKKEDISSETAKEKRGRKRRVITKEMGAAGASDAASNESKTRRVRRSGTRTKNSNSKSVKKIRSK